MEMTTSQKSPTLTPLKVKVTPTLSLPSSPSSVDTIDIFNENDKLLNNAGSSNVALDRLRLPNSGDGSTTAPILPIRDDDDEARLRVFSFGATAAVTPGAAHSPTSGAPPRRNQRYLRQNTVSGEATIKDFPQLFSRAISRTYTLTSNASSSIAVEEWRPVFDKLDLESDGKLDGHVPIDKFRQILEDDPVWVETVPPHVQDQILEKADRNKDGTIDFGEFLDLIRGTSMGFNRRKRRAFRQLLKQTVEFIVPYKYSYQNQYSCSPPPLFMIVVSALQVFVFAYNSAVIGYIGVNGPVAYCSNLIYDPNKREQIWRFLTYMFIHSGLFHAIFNILIQLVLGIPLEMVHGKFIAKYIFVCMLFIKYHHRMVASGSSLFVGRFSRFFVDERRSPDRLPLGREWRRLRPHHRTPGNRNHEFQVRKTNGASQR